MKIRSQLFSASADNIEQSKTSVSPTLPHSTCTSISPQLILLQPSLIFSLSQANKSQSCLFEKALPMLTRKKCVYFDSNFCSCLLKCVTRGVRHNREVSLRCSLPALSYLSFLCLPPGGTIIESSSTFLSPGLGKYIFILSQGWLVQLIEKKKKL